MPYAQFTVDMTSNSAPSGYTTAASHEFSVDTAAWKLHDGNLGAANYWFDNIDADNWCYFHSPTSHILKKYTLKTHNDGGTNTNPYAWFIEGSNNGSSWTQIDSQSNSLAVNTTYTYDDTWPTPSAYTYHRIYVWAKGAAGVSTAGCAITEVVYYEEAVAAATDTLPIPLGPGLGAGGGLCTSSRWRN